MEFDGAEELNRSVDALLAGLAAQLLATDSVA